MLILNVILKYYILVFNIYRYDFQGDNMKFSALGAFNGDAFTIIWHNSAILVDGGMPNTAHQIKESIKNKKLEAVFITHVDYDHLGGILRLAKDRLPDFQDTEFYMNHPDLVASYSGTKVAFHHGATLRALINSQGNDLKAIYKNDKLIINDLNIDILSPSEKICDELHSNWDLSRVADERGVRYLKRQVNNGDIINASSIAMKLSFDNLHILLLGDSHADIIVTSIQERINENENYARFDLVKLSHHGSMHNTNSALLNLIDCKNYYISTNGGTHYHPDSETIKLLSEKAVKCEQIFNIYLNYNIEKDIRNRCDFEIENLHFIYKRELLINELD